MFAGSLKVLAAELGLSYTNFTRTVQALVEEGRLRSVGRGQHRLQSFHVTDPAEWVKRPDKNN